MGLNTFEILQEIRALEDLLNEVNPETGEFVNNEDVIKDYIINLQTSKENKLNNIEDLKLELKAQREDLKQCLAELFDDYAKGIKRVKVYRQMKMYNDQNLNPSLYKNQK